MPYKDPKHKAEWERTHRQQRLDRRRELRRIESARETVGHGDSGMSASPWPLLAAGSVIAFSNPWLGISAGGLTVGLAAARKANWQWWIIGAVVAILSIFVLLGRRNDSPKAKGSEVETNE